MRRGYVFGNPKGNHPTDPGPIPVRSFQETRRFLPGAQFVHVGDEVDLNFDRIYFKHGLDQLPDDDYDGEECEY